MSLKVRCIFITFANHCPQRFIYIYNEKLKLVFNEANWSNFSTILASLPFFVHQNFKTPLKHIHAHGVLNAIDEVPLQILSSKTAP